MRNPHGSLRITEPGGTIEHDSITCAHCNAIYVVPHRHEESATRPPAQFCFACKQAICPRCVGKDCSVFTRKLDLVERKRYSTRQLERILNGEKV